MSQLIYPMMDFKSLLFQSLLYHSIASTLDGDRLIHKRRKPWQTAISIFTVTKPVTIFTLHLLNNIAHSLLYLACSAVTNDILMVTFYFYCNSESPQDFLIETLVFLYRSLSFWI